MESSLIVDDGSIVLLEDGVPLRVTCSAIGSSVTLAWIENACGYWLEWEGAWELTTEQPQRLVRSIKLCAHQPTHRIYFAETDLSTDPPSLRPAESWLVLADFDVEDQSNVPAWSHREWTSPTNRYEDGGAWSFSAKSEKQPIDVWLYHNKTTPFGKYGLLSVYPLEPTQRTKDHG